MADEHLALVLPSRDLHSAFLSLLGEDPRAAGASRYEQARGDFPTFLQALRDEAAGIRLAPGLVPQHTYWLMREDGVIVGVSRLRTLLTPALEDVGGHIGYDIRPSERRKGYGTLLLALTLRKARMLGLPRVLLTCNTDNIASARIIEKNGGILASQSVSPLLGVLVSRYWITVANL